LQVEIRGAHFDRDTLTGILEVEASVLELNLRPLLRDAVGEVQNRHADVQREVAPPTPIPLVEEAAIRVGVEVTRVVADGKRQARPAARLGDLHALLGGRNRELRGAQVRSLPQRTRRQRLDVEGSEL